MVALIRYMKKKRTPLNIPFDVSYTISFSGRTMSDGKPTTTTQMIKDRIIETLEICISKGYIQDYTISAQINDKNHTSTSTQKDESNKKD